MATLDDTLQVAIRQGVPWSKPSAGSRSWGTPEIARLKTLLQGNKNLARISGMQEDIQEPKKFSASWKRAIRKGQWAHREAAVQRSERPAIASAMKAPNKLRTPQGLCDILSNSTFQGMCGVLREAFFPAKLAPPPPLTPPWLPPALVEMSNPFTHISSTEVNRVI